MLSHERQAIALKSLDSVIAKIRPVSRPVHGWLRAVRDALQLSRATIAAPLKVSPQAIQSYEQAEKNEAISIATLRRAAAAVDCELVIALVPKNGRTFSELAAAHDSDRQHLRATEHSMALKNQASHDLSPLQNPTP